MPYTPERDLHGEVIADLSTAEIQRRLAVIGGDTHPISTQYRRAYEKALRDRSEG